MIDKPILPNPIGTKLKHDDLIFTSSDPMKTRVTINDYSIIVCDNDPKVYVSTLINCLKHGDVKIPYYLQHIDLFENAQKIFTECFGTEPDVLIASIYKKDYTKSSFLFGNRKMIDNSLKNIDNEYKIELKDLYDLKSMDKKIKTESNLRKFEYLKINDKELTIKLPSRVFPVIGASNDLNFHTNPNFSLIFGSFLNEEIYRLTKIEEENNYLELNEIKSIYNESKEEDSNPSEWIYHIDEELEKSFGNGIPLYCIKRFDLHNPYHILGKIKKKQDIQPFNLFKPWDVNAFYTEINDQAAAKFNDVIVRLMLGYNRASHLPITIDAFSATMADFFELDRTPETVELSSSLQGKLRRKYQKSKSFANGIGNLSVKHFIEYFIVESIIDFDKFHEDPTKEFKHAMAERNETYKLIGNKEILSSFLDKGSPNQKYNRFLNGQILARKNISPWVNK
jgi:hypothetical protein